MLLHNIYEYTLHYNIYKSKLQNNNTTLFARRCSHDIISNLEISNVLFLFLIALFAFERDFHDIFVNVITHYHSHTMQQKQQQLHNLPQFQYENLESDKNSSQLTNGYTN